MAGGRASVACTSLASSTTGRARSRHAHHRGLSALHPGEKAGTPPSVWTYPPDGDVGVGRTIGCQLQEFACRWLAGTTAFVSTVDVNAPNRFFAACRRAEVKARPSNLLSIKD